MKVFRNAGGFPGVLMLLGLARAAFADGLDTWTPRVSGTTNRLNGVTYGSASPAGNLFVVVGEGALLTSSNALDWTQQFFGGGILRSVAAGNGTFVVVPDNRGHTVLSSTNGVAWAVTNPTPTLFGWPLRAVAFLGGQFVLIGFDLYTSPEGRNWTYRTSDNEFWADSIAYGNGTFFAPTDYRGFISTGQNLWTLGNVIGPGKLVAFGNGVFVSPWVGHFVTSTDAMNWTAPGSLAISPNAITFAMGMFVTVGNSGAILTSPDGFNWRARNSGVTNHLQGVAFAGSSFIAVGDGGLILQSGPIFILRGRKGPDGFELELTGEVGRSYRLQVSPDSRNWSDYVGFTSTQPTTTLVDPSAGQSLSRFYRAVSP